MNNKSNYKRGTWQERLWYKIKPSTSSLCWEWSGSKFRKMKYGRLVIKKGLIMAAHRAAYESVYGKIPSGMCVLHKCDNPPCCRPSHLYLGTRKENNKDRDNKMRMAFGERNGKTILKENEVRQLLKLKNFYPIRKIARIWKIPKGTIHSIMSGKNWKHIGKIGNTSETG